MRTHISRYHYDLEKLHLTQVRGVRLPTVSLRGTVAVRVASAAAPASRSIDLSSSSDVRGSISRRARSNGSADEGHTAEVARAHTSDESELPLPVSEDAANLERAASSGFATTSSSAAPPTGGRKRSAGVGNGVKSENSGSHGSGHNGVRSSKRKSGFQPREYTAQLAAASSVAELQLLFELGRDQNINAIHVATLWTRLAKLVSAPGTGFSRSHVNGQTPLASAASSSSSAAAASQQTEPVALAAFVEALQATTTPQQLASMEARGLANVVWAAAKLKPQKAGAERATALPEAAAAAPAADASVAGEGLEEQSGATPSSESTAEAAASAPEAPVQEQERPRPLRIRGGRKAMAAAASAAVVASADPVSRLSTTVVSEALLEAWATAAGRKLSGFNMQDISNVVWALGRLGYQPSGLFMTQLSIALLKELPRVDRPQQLSNVLLGLALLRFVPPIKDFWAPMWQAVNRVVLMDQKVPDVQGVSNTLWALSQLAAHCSGDMPPVPTDVISKAVFRAVQWGNRLTATQCQDVFTSLPRLGFEPSEYQASKLLSLAQRVMPSCDGQALSNILVSLIQMRVRPRRLWMGAFMEAFQQQLPVCSPEALARVLFCVGSMRQAPPAWLPKAWEKLQTEMHLLSATDIAFTVLAISRMFPELVPQPEAAESKEQKQEEEKADGEERTDASETATLAVVAEAAAEAPDGAEAVVEASRPPRELLVALRDAWDRAGDESQLAVVFGYRALVQEFLDAALA